MAGDGEPGGEPARDGGISVRLLRAFETLIGAHLSAARDEAARDARRIVGGVVLLVAAAVLVLLGLALVHAAAAWLVVEELRVSWPAGLSAVAGGDLGVALLLALVARSRLAAPVLRRTRDLARRTAAALTGD